jgi:hypothetical protein
VFDQSYFERELARRVATELGTLERMTTLDSQPIHTPQAVRYLLDATMLICLEPTFDAERTVTEIAQRLGTTVRAVHYRVQQLLACGLVRVTREEKRSGRAVKYYRAAATRFFIPFSATDHQDVEALWLSLTVPHYESLVRALAGYARHQGHALEEWGVHIGSDGVGGLNLNLGPQQPRAGTAPKADLPSLLEWEELHLTVEQARDLKNKLKTLLESYLNERGPRTFLFGLGLAPQPLVTRDL